MGAAELIKKIAEVAEAAGEEPRSGTGTVYFTREKREKAAPCLGRLVDMIRSSVGCKVGNEEKMR